MPPAVLLPVMVRPVLPRQSMLLSAKPVRVLSWMRPPRPLTITMPREPEAAGVAHPIVLPVTANCAPPVVMPVAQRSNRLPRTVVRSAPVTEIVAPVPPHLSKTQCFTRP